MFDKKQKQKDLNRVFRENVTFQNKISDSPFEDLDSYEDYIKVRAEVNWSRTRLMKQANTENTREALVFIIRYRKDLSTKMRVVYDDEYYEIESIIPLTNENLYLEISCYKYGNDVL